MFARIFLGETSGPSSLLHSNIQELGKIKPAKIYADAEPLLNFFGCCATYQAGGKIWVRWSQTVRPQLVAAQRKDDNYHGSWDPVGPNARSGGRICATALAILSLQTYYRYTKFHR